ncbi:MAG: DUF4838 domain-containing protein [Acidobacteriaceae bacterium]|nr:DUF4838 domain-containing protein [Acidobacteriaceae bacterium]
MRRIVSSFAAIWSVQLLALAAPFQIVNRGEPVPIVIPERPFEPEQFAATELSRYLALITGSSFPVVTNASVPAGKPAFLLGRALAEDSGIKFSESQFGADGFLLRRSGEHVFVAGTSSRGTLYATYALLEKLGCRWFAPNFDFYSPARGEYVPHLSSPQIDSLDQIEKPSFAYRVKYIEEGRSHTPENLKQLVDWMAKLRLNALNSPIDYEHEGRAKWDNYRAALIPELRKRAFLLEVGGHGYQNFLPPERYFKEHPEWFAMIAGKRTDSPNTVFSTSNPQAMATFIQNVRQYLRARPEIHIFDCLPPDMTRWSEAPEDVALGSPSDRQIRLLNTLAAALKSEFPKLRIQFNAYSSFVEPPETQRPVPSLLMSFSAYARSFETSLFDPSNSENAIYANYLEKWTHGIIDPAQVTIYSYITKYQWRSLPILIPHLIDTEIRRYRSMQLGGLETYSEPAPWSTFELDHYITSRLLWNADLDVDAELADYARARYGPAALPVLRYLRLVEEIVPHAVGIPGTTLETNKQKTYIERFESAAGMLDEAKTLAGSDPGLQALIAKLDWSRRYTSNEMQLRFLFRQAGVGWRRDQMSNIEKLLAERRRIIEEGQGKGVILVDQRIS